MALNQKNLRAVLFVSFLIISIIPVLLLGWWVMDSTRNNVYKAVEEKHLLVAKNLSLALSRYAQDISAIMRHLANRPMTNVIEENADLLHSQNISSIRIFDKNGNQTFGLSTQDKSEPRALTSEQLGAIQGLPSRSGITFLPVQHNIDGEPRILIVQPIISGSNYLVAEMTPNYFVLLQGKIKFGVLGHAAIVDQEGNVLAHPKPEWVKTIKNISKVSAVQRMKNRETGVEQFYSPAKKADMIAGLTFVKETGWGVMVPQPVAELDSRIDQIKYATLGIGAFGLALASLISWFLSNKLTIPTQQLSAWQKAVLDSADYSIISTDTTGVIATFNKKAEQLLGYSSDDVIGKFTPQIIHDPEEVSDYAKTISAEYGEDIKPGFEVFVRKARDGILDQREWSYVRKDGTKLPVYLSVTALRSAYGEIIGFLGIATDLTEHKSILADLREKENLYQSLFTNAGDAIVLMDATGMVVDCNPATLKLFGYSRDEYLGKPAHYYSPDLQPDCEPSIEKAHKILSAAYNGKKQVFEWEHIRNDGSTFNAEVSLSKVEIENKPYLQGIIRDITERKALEMELAFQAGHDSLTGLPNRKSLHEAFPEHVRLAEESNGYVVMMLLDLNRFKEINDTLGHHLGDQVISQVGPRLSDNVAAAATIARLGGDEFALILSTDAPAAAVQQMAESLSEALRRPFDAGGFNVIIGASVGVAIYPEHGTNSHELLRAADVAMYAAKKSSRNVTVYDHSIDEYSTQRLTVANELDLAIKANQLVLHYQPKINISSGKVSGLEALVRWEHPTEGLKYPASFLDIVEMSDAIHPFTQAVIELAVSDKQKMQVMGVDLPIAINLSARSLIDDSCLKTMVTAIAENNLEPSAFELELTESAVMHEPESAVALLSKFHEKGINTAIDDFGRGYSSLSYLRQLPVSALKIDRSFVMDMLLDDQDSAIVKSTVALAHGLDLKVIAEGVEDKKTLKLLREMECDEAQGYGICKPKPLDDFVEWLEKYNG